MTKKEKFIKYCEGRIRDLDLVTYTDIFGEETTAQIIMEADIREYNNLYVITPLDTDSENLIAIDKDGVVKIDTPMISPIYYATRMEFKTIETEFYNSLLEWWDDLELEEE